MAAVFHLAVSEGDVTKVRFLMKYSPGLRVDSVNKFGLTALQQAALDGNVDIVNFLLEKGADLNCVDTDGRTALHLASQEGHLGVVSLLVTSACANVNAKTKQGYKAFDLAQSEQVRALLSQAMLTESFKRKCSFDEDDFEPHPYVQEYRNTPGCRNSFSSASTDSGVYDESYVPQDGFGHRSSPHRTSLRGYPSSRHSVISEDSGISDATTYDNRHRIENNRRRSSSIENSRFRSNSIDSYQNRRVDDLQTTSILRSNSFTTNRDNNDDASSVDTTRSELTTRNEMQRYRRAEPKAYARDASRRKTVTFGVTERERETGRAETSVKYCGTSYSTQEETTKTRRITKPLPPVPTRVPPRAESSPIPPDRNTKPSYPRGVSPTVPPRGESPLVSPRSEYVVVSPRGESPPVPPRVKSPPVPSPRTTSPRSGSPSPTPSPRIAPRASPEQSPRFSRRTSPEPTPRKSPITSPRSPPNNSPRMPLQPPPLVTPRAAITPRSASMKVRGEPDRSGYNRVVPRRPRTEMAAERRNVESRRSFHAGFSSRGVN